MRKGKKMLLCGLFVTALGLIIIPYIKIFPLFNTEYPEFTFVSPGLDNVEVGMAGKYYIWNDFKTFYNNRSYNNSKTLPNGTTFKITDSQTGEELKLNPDQSITVSVGDNQQSSVGYIELEGKRTLNIHVSSSEERVFTFAQSRFMSIIKTLFGTFIACAFLSVFGIFLIIFGAIRMTAPRPPAQTESKAL